ncbi:putative transcription factor [Corchorus capsularis]|uniref:Putative transcription factor n=1 Tax=Corchorus capsularis TaxID=210143 RepID=A0A1R3I1P4_COCAP|nr:putative transcription factor [Corchorus capsularis]
MEEMRDHYSMEDHMAATPPTSSTHHNPKPPTSKSTSYNYGSLLENEDNYFEGILTGESMQNSSSQQIDSSPKQNLSMALAAASTTVTTVPVKRGAPPPQYWNHHEPNSSSIGSQSGKRFQGDLNSTSSTGGIDETSSFVSLLNQLPQNAPFYPGTFVGSLGDSRQQFILPSMNWNS